MKFSQSSFVYFNYPLQEAIRRLHAVGYQGVEVWGGRPHAYRHDLDEQMGEILSLLDDCQMTVCNLIPAQFRYPSILCALNEKVREDSVRYIKDAIDNAMVLQAPYVSLCPGMTLHGEPLDKGWTQLRRSIEELLEYTEGNDVTLLVEPAHKYESTLIRTVEEGLRMLSQIGSERLGILLDTGHANLNGENLVEAVHSLAGVPLHIHIDDNCGESDAHLIPGEGEIDLRAFARALEDIEYQGFVSTELGFQYTLNPDRAVKQSYEALTRIFG